MPWSSGTQFIDTAATASGVIWCSWNNELTSTLCSVTTNEIGDGMSSSWDTSNNISSIVWNNWNNSFVTMYGTGQTPRVLQHTGPLVQPRYDAPPHKPSIAVQNAEKLLLSVLDEKQKEDWVARGQFYVHVGPRKYRIRRGRIGNVELVDPETDEILQRYCAHPVQPVPNEDTAVAQLLHLRHDEQRFIGLANVHYTKPGFVGGLRG